MRVSQVVTTGGGKVQPAGALNYVDNVVPATSPGPGWVTAWLVGHGFVREDGGLRRVRGDGAG